MYKRKYPDAAWGVPAAVRGAMTVGKSIAKMRDMYKKYHAKRQKRARPSFRNRTMSRPGARMHSARSNPMRYAKFSKRLGS